MSEPIDTPTDEKVEIEYPCPWRYRVIGRDAGALMAAIHEVMGETPYEVRPSNESAKGSFRSIIVETVVTDEAHRVGLFEGLRQHRSVMLVL